MNEKVLKTLEYDKILLRLEALAVSDGAKALCRSLKPMTEKEDILTALKETSDAEARFIAHGNPGFTGIHDIRAGIKRAQSGSSLSMPELLRIEKLLAMASKAKTYGREDSRPEPDSLSERFGLLSPLTPLRQLLEADILSEEEMADQASPGLAKVRRQLRTISDRIHTELNALHPLVSLIPGFHAEYTTGVDEMRVVSELVHRHRAPFFTHISETEREQAECLARHGMTPTELFDSLGLFDYGGGGYHCCHLSDHDMQIFRDRGLFVVSCPASNAKLASGIAPLRRYADAGIRLALGTDGPSSNNALDMFREMYLAAVLQKLLCHDAAALDAETVLRAATVGSARAMGLRDCDVIAVGKQADLIVIDLDRPSMRPIVNIPQNLVYSGGRDCVKLTMIAGRVLYEDGEFHLPDSPERIYAEAQRELQAMLGG